MIQHGNRSSRLRLSFCAVLLASLAACGGGKGSIDDSTVGADAAQGETLKVAGQTYSSRTCAVEGGQCSFSGTQLVAYGANGRYNVRLLTGGAACNNGIFGDAMVGVIKTCFLLLGLTLGPPTVAADAPVTPVPPISAGLPSMPPAMPTMPVTMPTNVSMPIASPAVDLSVKPSKPEAARFLVQSTYGPNLAEIDRLSSIGYGAWMDEQFAAAPMDTHWAYVRRKGPLGCNPCNSGDINTVMESFWMQAVRGPDQLRQRTVVALSEIFVVSTVNTWIDVVSTAHAGYLDMLARNAFGNFRTLLEQVATHPSMGAYLSHLQNEKEDPATGRLPDENFARELMQLFSIGLWELNDDGSRKKDGSGNDMPTYSQADIMGMAKVFTGWSWGNGDWQSGFTNANPNEPYERAFNQPMMVYPTRHSTSEKRIIRGVVIPANTPGAQSLKVALDTLFNHPNVGPFIGSQLIKRLVTSNPSPAYIKRVTQTFNDNGSGVRGDMKAVIRAVLIDPEARDIAKLVDPQWGKLREPMIRYANFLRAFNVKSTGGSYKIWNLEDTLSSVGQNPIRAPSVFNWFRPDYAPPGALAAQGLVAPEFQITHETTTTGYANFMRYVAEHQNSWFRDNVMAQYGPTRDYLAGDYSAEIALASNPGALLDRLNLLLMAGQMSAGTRKTILDAVNAAPVDANAGQRRVAFAVYLTMQSPEFIVQK